MKQQEHDIWFDRLDTRALDSICWDRMRHALRDQEIGLYPRYSEPNGEGVNYN